MNENNNEKQKLTPEENQEETEDFAALMESYMPEEGPELRVGDKITGEIIAIGDDCVFLNTGGKTDGVAEKAELLDKDGQLPYKKGDQLELFVVSTSNEELKLAKTIGSSGNDALLYDAQQSKIPVSGNVTETCKGGFRVQVMGKTAFCPISQIDTRYVETPEEYVGSELEFLIERIESGGRNIIVNRRKYLERLFAEAAEEFIKSAKPGDTINGTVVRLMPFGAFVEIQPGVEGMVHISELSWSRVSEPSEAVKIGETLPVKILSMETNKGKLKIALSSKQVSDSPWETAADKYHVGDKITGRVTRCADFGAFVEVAPGIEGLVHISEISYMKRVVKTEDELQPGQAVSVKIKAVDPENRRLSLSIKDADGDPWLNIEDNFSVGQVVKGRLENKADFGFFVNLTPGVTGLLPISNIDRAPDPKAVEKTKPGDSISVTIEAIDKEAKKITLASADATDSETMKKYMAGNKEKDNTAQSSGGLSDLGKKLQEAMATKK